MPRRPPLTPDELREKIVAVSTEIIKERGLSAFTAREIARLIGYSPGTIYNVFRNLDEIILKIESQLLERLDAKLQAVPNNGDARSHLLEVADAYVAFTHDNVRLWNLLFEHRMPDGQKAPEEHQQRLDGLLQIIEDALSNAMSGANHQDVQRSARVLWASVHGITSLSTTDKLSNVTTDSAQPLVRDLVSTYLAGLQKQ